MTCSTPPATLCDTTPHPLHYTDATYRMGVASRQETIVISIPCAVAVQQLQSLISKTSDLYIEERAERAQDEILRTVSDADAHRQVRSASAHAGQVLKRRRETLRITSLDAPEQSATSDRVGSDDSGYAVVDMRLWLLSSPRLKSSEKVLLLALASGHDAESLAARDGLPIAQVRQRISRARRAAVAAYTVEVAA